MHDFALGLSAPVHIQVPIQDSPGVLCYPESRFLASVLFANVTNTTLRIIVALNGISRQPAFEASNRRYLPT